MLSNIPTIPIMLRQLVRHLISALFPTACVLCTTDCSSTFDLCDFCRQRLPFLTEKCKQCAQSLPIPPPSLCGACLASPPPFELTFALFLYQAPVTHMIKRFKFSGNLLLGRVLSGLLLEKIHHDWYLKSPLPQVIIPIPLHPKRLRERGFNQALEIAKPLGKALKIPVKTAGISRNKYTVPQTTLPAIQRKKNIANAFSISEPLAGLHVAVLDDVITTGHTMREFCSQLKRAGVRQIDVWCCATVFNKPRKRA